MSEAQGCRVFLAGQPNAGKSALFNRLTGASARVGNYPGVTVERHEGKFYLDGRTYQVLDLPGTYSLSAYSPEERVAQDEILDGRPDVLVVVVDANTLRRSLVLLAQLMQLQVRLVLCLNMSDEAERAGQRIDLFRMAGLLGLPVLRTVGHRGEGVDQLKQTIASLAARPVREGQLVLGERLARALAPICRALKGSRLNSNLTRWAASKLLMADPNFTELAAREGPGRAAMVVAERERASLQHEVGRDVNLFVAEQEAGFVDELLREVVVSPSRGDARRQSDRIDTVLAHRLLGLPVFGLILYGLFWLTFDLGELPMGWIEAGFAALGDWVSSLWPAGSEAPLRSLLVDGVIGGVGGVIVFLPNILLLFLGLAILEDSGYMARAAHLLDRWMHRFGLHGKSFLPMITGFGCSIPGIMATRTLENEKDRLITMLVLPLMSCGARLPIWMLLIPAFFPPGLRAPMLFLIYLVGVFLALGLALLLRRTLFQGEEAPFVMELPPYRAPTLSGLATKLRERTWLYLRKAGTVILAISVLMWVLTAYPKPAQYEVDRLVAVGELTLDQAGIENRRAEEALRHSLAGRLGRVMEPVIAPLGFDWKIGTALVGAFAAKEVFVAQMGITHSLGEVDEGSDDLRQALARDYSPLVGLSLMVFLLIGTPCMATVAITRRESGRWKWALLQFGGLTALAYLASLLVFQVGRLFF